ncbi:hypothetical protein [Sessilibacter corallicola]|uniref:hypothetical protein n=1 Tax=Sessilibacter corallicola TaxID=2904075 RepID=UPI001E5E04E3|nr:hypothetical protein [Sessilibacter corallicola]MCE2027494.1 hypothetical protein [Sessilibacter corallicola]
MADAGSNPAASTNKMTLPSQDGGVFYWLKASVFNSQMPYFLMSGFSKVQESTLPQPKVARRARATDGPSEFPPRHLSLFTLGIISQ